MILPYLPLGCIRLVTLSLKIHIWGVGVKGAVWVSEVVVKVSFRMSWVCLGVLGLRLVFGVVRGVWWLRLVLFGGI